jgi:carbonic anhydrase
MEHDAVFERMAGRRKHRVIGIVAVAVGFGLAACSSGSSTTATSAPAAVSSTTSGAAAVNVSAAVSTTAVSTAAVSTAPDEVAWTYSGDAGPENWGSIAPGCDPGSTGSQSPIDIESAGLVPEAPATAGAVTINYLPTVFEVENTGRTIEAVPEDVHTNSITIDGKSFYLLQFHLHNPSEHTVDNASFGMELHLVNKSDDGALAVLGVLMNTGGENSPLAELFSKMPTTKTDENSMVALDEKIDPSELIPAGSKVARYSGSLTTPPCTEPVIWSVFLTPSSVSSKQLTTLGTIFPGNHRPTQPLNGRVVNDVQYN